MDWTDEDQRQEDEAFDNELEVFMTETFGIIMPPPGTQIDFSGLADDESDDDEDDSANGKEALSNENIEQYRGGDPNDDPSGYEADTDIPMLDVPKKKKKSNYVSLPVGPFPPPQWTTAAVIGQETLIPVITGQQTSLQPGSAVVVPIPYITRPERSDNVFSDYLERSANKITPAVGADMWVMKGDPSKAKTARDALLIIPDNIKQQILKQNQMAVTADSSNVKIPDTTAVGIINQAPNGYMSQVNTTQGSFSNQTQNTVNQINKVNAAVESVVLPTPQPIVAHTNAVSIGVDTDGLVDWEEEIQDLRQQLADQQKEYEKLNQTYVNAVKDYSIKATEAGNRHDETVNNLKKNLSKQQTIADEFKNRNTKLQNKLSQQGIKNQDQSEEISKLQKEVKSLQTSINEMTKVNLDFENDNANLDIKLKQAKQQLIETAEENYKKGKSDAEQAYIDEMVKIAAELKKVPQDQRQQQAKTAYDVVKIMSKYIQNLENDKSYLETKSSEQSAKALEVAKNHAKEMANYQGEISAFQQSTAELQKDLTKLQEENDNYNQQVLKMTKENSYMQNQINKFQHYLKDVYDYSDALKNYVEGTGSLVKAREAFNDLYMSKKDFEGKLDIEQRKTTKLESDKTKLKEEISDLKNQLLKLNGVELENTVLQGENSNLEKQNLHLKGRIEDLESDLGNLEGKKVSLESELAIEKQSHKSLRAKFMETEKALSKSEAEVNRLELSGKTLREQVIAMEGKYNDTSDELMTEKKKTAELTNQLNLKGGEIALNLDMQIKLKESELENFNKAQEYANDNVKLKRKLADQEEISNRQKIDLVNLEESFQKTKLELEKKLTLKQNELNELDEASKDRIEKLESELKAQTENMGKQIKKKEENLKTQLAEAKIEYEKMLADANKKNYYNLQQQLGKQKAELDKIEEELSNKTSEVSSLTSELSSKESIIKAKDKAISELRNEVETQHEKIKESKITIGSKIDKVKELENSLKRLTKTNGNLENDLEKAKSELGEKQKQIEKASSENENALKEKTKLELALEEANDKYNKHAHEYEQLEKVQKQIKDSMERLESEKIEWMSKANTIDIARREIEEKLVDAQTQMKTQMTDISRQAAALISDTLVWTMRQGGADEEEVKKKADEVNQMSSNMYEYAKIVELLEKGSMLTEEARSKLETRMAELQDGFKRESEEKDKRIHNQRIYLSEKENKIQEQNKIIEKQEVDLKTLDFEVDDLTIMMHKQKSEMNLMADKLAETLKQVKALEEAAKKVVPDIKLRYRYKTFTDLDSRYEYSKMVSDATKVTELQQAALMEVFKNIDPQQYRTLLDQQLKRSCRQEENAAAMGATVVSMFDEEPPSNLSLGQESAAVDDSIPTSNTVESRASSSTDVAPTPLPQEATSQEQTKYTPPVKRTLPLTLSVINNKERMIDNALINSLPASAPSFLKKSDEEMLRDLTSAGKTRSITGLDPDYINEEVAKMRNAANNPILEREALATDSAIKSGLAFKLAEKVENNIGHDDLVSMIEEITGKHIQSLGRYDKDKALEQVSMDILAKSRKKVEEINVITSSSVDKMLNEINNMDLETLGIWPKRQVTQSDKSAVRGYVQELQTNLGVIKESREKIKAIQETDLAVGKKSIMDELYEKIKDMTTNTNTIEMSAATVKGPYSKEEMLEDWVGKGAKARKLHRSRDVMQDERNMIGKRTRDLVETDENGVPIL